jgi:DNA-directed RNA polymerase
VRAGFWLVESALEFEFFEWDDDDYLIIAPKYQGVIDARCEEILRLDTRPHKPLTEPPPDWVGWQNYYKANGRKAPFVRDMRPETRNGIEAAFKAGGFEHARAVNILQRTALTIDQRMLAVVKERALELVNEKTKASDLEPRDMERQLKANRRALRKDIATCNEIGEQTFWLPYRCDWRGRMNPLTHFHFGREDHIRALFKFASGLRIGGDPYALKWLRINCANAHGESDKESFDDREAWTETEKNRDLIQRVAENPSGTFKEWRGVDNPFQFVAACMELVGALADPENFETRLPIGMDATANGLQHLALIARDVEAAARLNVFPSDRPRDPYGDVAAAVREKLSKKKDGKRKSGKRELAIWWHRTLDVRPGLVRKLFKKPIMSIPYGARRLAKQLQEAYPKFKKETGASDPPDGAYPYLAKLIKETAKELFPGPMAIMDYVRELADYRTERDGFLRWTSPSGFPVSNVYREYDKKLDFIPIHLHRPVGGQVRLRAAFRRTGKLKESKPRTAAGANFIHSMDASHLVRVIIAAKEELNIEMLANHDCFYTVAPLAEPLHKRIPLELFFMHYDDRLAHLRDENVYGPLLLPMPPRGNMDEFIAMLEPTYLTN